MNIEDSIELLLSHFDKKSLFPRKMMTKKSGYQFTISSNEEIFQECLFSDLVDCRINAYPEQVNPGRLTNQTPDFIFIDLDLSSFQKYKDSNRALDRTLKNTLEKISILPSQKPSQHTLHSLDINSIDEKQPFVVKPTVLWSGNGYHIYLPIQALVLDHFEPFSKEKYPNLFIKCGCKYPEYSVSELFLLFAKQFLTNGKADPQHRPKFKTCLIRIPNTFNSKGLEKGLSFEESKVKIIQKWNGYRPPIQLLTKEFRRWLLQEEINQKIQNKKFQKVFTTTLSKKNISRIEWIETLLKVPLEDQRKSCLWRILIPYLVNVKKVVPQETIILLGHWLDQCDKLRKTNFNHRQFIMNNLRYVKSYLPPSRNRLKNDLPELYTLLKTKDIVD
jgi:hypothetical protein